MSTQIQPVVPPWPRQDTPPIRVSLNDDVAFRGKGFEHRSGPRSLRAAFVGIPEYRRIAEPDQVVIRQHRVAVRRRVSLPCAGADGTTVPVRPYGVSAPPREHLPPGVEHLAGGVLGGRRARVIRWFMWLEELRVSLQPRTRVPGLIDMLRASARQLDLDHGSRGCLSRAR